MSKHATNEELFGLLTTALDGDASDEQLQRLNEILCESAELRQAATAFMCDDALLSEEIGTIEQALRFLEQRSVRSVRSTSSSVEVHAAGTSPIRNQAAVGQTRVGGRRSRVLSAVNSHGLAVAVVAVTFIGILFWQQRTMTAHLERLQSLAALPDDVESRLKEGIRRNAAVPSATTVARVTGLADCRWVGDNAGLEFGDELTPGQRLQLAEGVLQLTLNTGARVFLEGPADFIASTPNEATLSRGKIAAAIPRFARGYTVLTPSAEVVDLGTEFGVEVGEAGASEVHVFEGDVVTWARSEGAPSGNLIHARVDQAVRFDAEHDSPQLIAADPGKFVRHLSSALPNEELPPLPITNDLVLWLAADQIPGAKARFPISTWPDILIGDNRFPDDAWQFDERLCPVWDRDDAGRAVVRFDGWSNVMATSPVETGDRQTVFVVYIPTGKSVASSHHGGILLSYGLNAPTLELASMNDRSPRGRVWAVDAEGVPSNVGVLEGRPVEGDIPCAVAYQYDATTNRAEMFVNGQSAGAEDAPRPVAQHAKRFLGSHPQPWFEAYFMGGIYEVIIFDTALEEADRDRVFQYLSKRYDL